MVGDMLCRISPSQQQQREPMMIKEQVSIFVTLKNGKRFGKQVTVKSDGSFHNVNGLVSYFVNKEFKDYPVESFNWNYA